MKIALAQINPIVGDVAGNAALIRRTIQQAQQAGARLVVFPELALVGYPPKDLLLKPQFIEDNVAAMEALATTTGSCAALVGFVCQHTGPTGRALHNAAALLQDGRVVARYFKRLLPTYDVFDETRYFQPGQSHSIVELDGRRLGLTICEDIWQSADHTSRQLYDIKPLADLQQDGVDLFINMSASPFVNGKDAFRKKLFADQCRRYQLPLLYVNQVGGNDELIFDGCSCAFDRQGQIIAQARDFAEDLLLVDLAQPEQNRCETIRSDIASVHGALVLGLRDYVTKCGFSSVVLGLSGGIDSAVTACLAVDALGPDNVRGVLMPSRYTSDESNQDAAALAAQLGIKTCTIPIGRAHDVMEASLTDVFAGRCPDVTEENIQARLRGTILMALSNKFGHLLLSTGNKSELAVGYCTLYGDMAGGLAVISDVPKTMVYDLARFINRDRQIIPEASITKPPSAELRPDQTDQDSLPPYEQLDEILARYVEQEQGFGQIVAAGFDAAVVRRIIALVDHNEYKRKQAAPGLKVTGRAFGTGRRMPLAQRYQPCQTSPDSK